MTNWLPDLSRFSGPRYRAIAEALATDIRDGRLTPGTRLPTHRDLAWRLRVTVGTVSRAYAEAERRGLIGGDEAPALAAVLARLAGTNDLAGLLHYSPSAGRPADREAGAAWIARN